VSARYGALVAAHGLGAAHRLIVEAVPPGAQVLDVGASTGYLGQALRERGCQVLGVEPDAEAVAESQGRGMVVLRGDIEDPVTREGLPRNADVVLFGDVLEHLRDPSDALSYTRELLAPGGRVVASIPNVAVWHARRELARGRFPYADHGIFDRTHLRFFTRRSARDLAQRAGYRVESERFAATVLPGEGLARRAFGGWPEHAPPAPVARLRERAAARCPELFALQFVLTLRPR
jgi:methionine biosynthesis protein MetW